MRMTWRLVTGPILQHPGRSLLCVLAIAMGVALGFAVQLINGSAIGEFTRAAQTLAGKADLTIRGARSGFDEAVYADLAQRVGVALASPALEVDAKLPGRDEPLRTIGLDVFRAGRLQPALFVEGANLLDSLRADTVFLSPAAMEWLGIRQGDSLTVQSGLAQHTLRVAGTLTTDDTLGRVAVMDIAAAQALFDRVGRISRVDLRLAAGVDTDRFIATLDLPPGMTAERPRDAGSATDRMTRAYRVNLDVLALVALFTGGLLVFSTQALSVAQRRAQIALLRVLGHTRSQIAGLLIAEGLILGVVGAVLGLAGGLALARIAMEIVGADLGAGYFQGVAPHLRVNPTAALTFGLLGLAAALGGSLGPALEAARAAPAVALKSGDDQRAFAALRLPWTGIACLVAGAIAANLPPIDDLPVFGYLAIAALLMGTILALPALTAFLLARIPRARHLAVTLAIEQLRARPAQAALSLAAIVAAVSLAVSMAVMVSSFRTSVDAWLEGILPADLYLRASSGGDSAFFTEADQSRIHAVPGIARLEFLRWQQVLLDPARPRVTLLARDAVDADAERRLPLVGAIATTNGSLPRAWLSEPAAALYGSAPGRRIAIPLNGRMHEFIVAGIWRDYARQNGAVLIDRATYIALSDDHSANDAGIWLAPGAATADVMQAIETRFGAEAIEFATPGEIRALSLSIFDRTFTVTYALEAAAILIGLVGLSSAIGSQVLARRREFGMLRHIGVTRGQIARMLATEGFIVAAVGLIIGGVLGFAMSFILIHVVNRQSFHWGMQMHVPLAGLALFFVVMLALATVTARLAGRQAMTGDAVRAVKEDW
ncbi:MAG: ABC transporter permease [Burkholderiales bacterium]|nr:ABC transporter permease [Burkholderiales bacterium]